MNTKTDKKTASAPETRTAVQLNKSRFGWGVMRNGELFAQELTRDAAHALAKRTIPAEKPTDYRVPTPCELVPYRTQDEYDKLKAHADALAEALRDILQWFAEPYDPSPKSLPDARQALAAYEAAQ